MNIKKRVSIAIGTSRLLTEIVQNFLFTQGYNWSAWKGEIQYNYLEDGQSLHLYANQNNMCFGSLPVTAEGGIIIDARTNFAGLVALFEIIPVSVKLNDNYTAVITKGGVTVGCTTFTHAAVLEVAEKIKEMQANE